MTEHAPHHPIITTDMNDALSARVDFYKPNMSQLAYEKHPEAQVTFTFKDRGNVDLLEHIGVDELSDRVNSLITPGFHDSELAYFASLKDQTGASLYRHGYLGYLAANSFPEVVVGEKDGMLHIESTGAWPLVTFAETVVMGEVVEAYFKGKASKEGWDMTKVYAEGDRRLSEKIALLHANPNFTFMEFGTRRHFSLTWHAHVLGRLATEAPKSLLGTSNLFLADRYGLKPMGTSAHEMDMVYAGLARDDDDKLRIAHRTMLDDWLGFYGPGNTTGLTDTFGARFFFRDLTESQAEQMWSVRQDSGNPVALGNLAIRTFTERGFDPLDRLIIFSDGLDIPEAIGLEDTFRDQTKPGAGIGTDITCDLGFSPTEDIRALNIVMKATAVDGWETVKLSDDPGKHTGPEDQIERYKRVLEYVPLGDGEPLN